MSWSFSVAGRGDFLDKADEAFHEARHGGKSLNAASHQALDAHMVVARSTRGVVPAEGKDGAPGPQITLESSGHMNDDGTGSSLLKVTIGA